jgi:chaperonin GroEL
LTEQAAAMEDLAALTGGRPVVQSAGDTLAGVKLHDLGHARRAWSDNTHFGIVGGKGNSRKLRQHIANLRAFYDRVDDVEERSRVRQRIGKLMGGSAALIVGGVNKIEIDARKDLAQRTADAMRGAVREGVLPGGGVALMACKTILAEKAAQSSESEEHVAYRFLMKAIEEPMRTILSNAGYDPSEIMGEIKHAGPEYGFDVNYGKVAKMIDAGVFDVVSVVKEAAFRAITSAGLALTTDVLIHCKNPEKAITP